MTRITCPHCSHSIALDVDVRPVGTTDEVDLASYLPPTTVPREPGTRAQMLSDLRLARAFVRSGAWTVPARSGELFQVFETWFMGRSDPGYGMTRRRLTQALVLLGATVRNTSSGRVYSPGAASTA